MRRTVLLLGMMSMVVASNSANAGDCENANSQLAMNLCAEEAFKKTDDELNHVYRLLMHRLSPAAEIATKKKLIAAQKAWIAFRDGECGFVSAGAVGGSIFPLVFTQCLDELTRRRVAELRKFLNCDGSDGGCPVPNN